MSRTKGLPKKDEKFLKELIQDELRDLERKVRAYLEWKGYRYTDEEWKKLWKKFMGEGGQ